MQHYSHGPSPYPTVVTNGRPYPHDRPFRPGSNPSLPNSTGEHQHPPLRPLSVAPGYETNQQPQQQPHLMDPSGHHGYPSQGNRPNGMVSHSMSAPPHPEGIATHPIDHNGGYIPSPISASPAYPSGVPYGTPAALVGVTTLGPPRRKAVRAAQACDACRQRKAKCDEGRPACAFCKENELTCVYRDVPPQKQDRSQAEIMTSLQKMNDSFSEQYKGLAQAVDSMKAELRRVERSLQAFTKSLPNSSGQVAEDAQENTSDTQETPRSSSSQNTGIRLEDYTHPMSRDQSVATENSSYDQNAHEILELSIPIEHTTAAQKLLSWDSIRKLTLSVRINEAYVMDLEKSRGLIRLYGRGEGGVNQGASHAGSPRLSTPAYFEHEHLLPVASDLPPADLWGGMIQDASENALRNQEGPLRLDTKTAYRFADSYFRHIHILHPFLQRGMTRKLLDSFLARYGPSSEHLAKPVNFENGSPGSFNRTQKRKRSAGGVPPMASNLSSSSTGSFPGPNPPDHSISTAIVLLVLALGAVCEHKDPLPGITGGSARLRSDPLGSPYGSPHSARPSPSSSQHNSFTSAYSPDDREASRRPSCEDPNAGSALRNIDIIPGLAYYAYATNILGNHHGGNELPHVHACLLAGLYAGQLARVIESWSWINTACRTCQTLFGPAEHRLLRELSRQTSAKQIDEELSAKLDPSLLAFWTCLQLESDLLAEMDLPPSGITRYEDASFFSMPNCISLDGVPHAPAPGSADETMMRYYYAQITIRKILNRAHTALYSAEKTTSKHAAWSILTSDDLAFQLDGWRKTLPEPLQWDDNDPPAKDINAARLRGKYYGAQYIIHRPFLHKALHSEKPSSRAQAVSSPMKNSPSMTGAKKEYHGSSPAPPFSETRVNKSIVSGKTEAEWTNSDIKILDAARTCICAAMRSTVAFDGVPQRLIVTNIFGTSHAQFGNLLVLSATYDSDLSFMVPREKLMQLLKRTIKFLRPLGRLSPTLKMDTVILEHIESQLFGSSNSVSSASVDGVAGEG
ncbi:MAG: hypothetical protein M1819_000954 [Sarea resinae]|nr:MAG: hypothetical protein M1819_000954 [Sarea resinae]